jgi:PD-(D/E)XK nuclease superfamily
MNKQTRWPTYNTASGEKVPSVTTIIGRFKDSGGLIYWAFKEGCAQGIEKAKTPAMNFDLYREKAAEAGTMAHDLVEAHIKGLDLPKLEGSDDTIAKANRAFDAFLKWQGMTKIEVRHTEVPLVSERYKFGGRIDAVGVIGDELVLLDWKTSNSVYADYTVQLAAYQLLWEENYPDYPLVGGAHLLRFAKEEGDFAHHHFPRLEKEAVTFLKMRELYDLVKAVEKRVK